MPTPHNNAAKGDFAKTVLMPGDPLRAKFIAETFLTEPKLVNNVRGVQGYTGTYKGTRVSVMASGISRKRLRAVEKRPALVNLAQGCQTSLESILVASEFHLKVGSQRHVSKCRHENRLRLCTRCG